MGTRCGPDEARIPFLSGEGFILKTSLLRSFALSLALVAVPALSSVAFADTPAPVKEKYHSPFNGDKERNPGEAGEGQDLADLTSLYQALVNAAAAVGRAACGTPQQIAKAQADLAAAQAAFEAAEDAYIRNYSNNLYAPVGTVLTPKQKDLEKPSMDADKKKVAEEMNKRVATPPPPAACPPAEHTSLPPGHDEIAWTGTFITVEGVGSWSRVGLYEYFDATDLLTNRFHDTGSGRGIGIGIGQNWQPWDDNTVVGVVFNVDLEHDGVRHDFPPSTAYIGVVTRFTGSAQARIGTLVTPNVLLYGHTGVSIADQSLNIDFGGPETRDHHTTPGYSLGAGGEMMLEDGLFGAPASLFVDYDHTWWNNAWLFRPAASPFFDYRWKTTSDVVRFGVRFHF